MLGYGGINGSDPARYALRSASPFSPAAMVPTAISVMGLSLVLFLPLIVPIDVFAAEREVRIGDFIRDLYYCTVAALLLFVFVLGPFAYFFRRQGVGVVGGITYSRS